MYVDMDAIFIDVYNLVLVCQPQQMDCYKYKSIEHVPFLDEVLNRT